MGGAGSRCPAGLRDHPHHHSCRDRLRTGGAAGGFIGDDAVLPRIGGALDKLLHDAGAEYLDCYNAGIPAAVWAAAGLTERREDDGVIIPNYLTPPLRQNTEYYYFTNQPDGFVLFKADGDQDRPNLPCD